MVLYSGNLLMFQTNEQLSSRSILARLLETGTVYPKWPVRRHLLCKHVCESKEADALVIELLEKNV
jgi:hypothetical protein